MDLHMQIGKKEDKKAKIGKLPMKKTVNLAMREQAKGGSQDKILIAVLVIVVIAAIAKFGVIDPLAKQSEARAAMESSETAYTEMMAKLANSDELLEQYHKYSTDWLEDGVAARTDILDMVEHQMMSVGTVQSLNVSGNTLIVSMNGMTLNDAATMVDKIKEEPLVSSVTVRVAQGDTGVTDMTFSLIIELEQEEAES